MFRQDFTCPALLKDNECSTLTGYHHSRQAFQPVQLYSSLPLAWSAFARHYLRSLG